MEHNILVVEDDLDIGNLIDLYLKAEGYNVFLAENGLIGLEILKKEQIDLGIFDVMMPIMDGYTLLNRARVFTNIPIIILTAKNSDNDKIQGLNIGADDYITKPFNPTELIARVKSHLRRYNVLGSNETLTKVTLDGLTLDTNKIELYKGEEEIIITTTEYKILTLLLSNPGHIFSKVQIAEHINGEFLLSDENTITVHISHLREKLGKNSNDNLYIKTVRGLGYKIDEK